MSERKRPNIVFIISDDHCRDVMGCAGDPYIQTPNMDRLAEEGCLFSNSFTVSGVCSPARASVLTGKYTHQCGAPNIIWKNNTFLTSAQTFPEILHDAGYHTAHIGKWHLGEGQIPKPGYDTWAGFEWLGEYFDTKVWIDGEMRQFEGYADDILSGLASDYIHKRAEAQPDQPFCLYLGLKAPHLHFCYPPRLENALDGVDIPKPPSFDEDYAQTGKIPLLEDTVIRINTFIGGLPLFNNSWEMYIKSYYRAVMALDEAVGTVMQALDDAGIADDTILVYTSDQGYCLGHHGLTEKHLGYEQVMRIPLIMRYPRLVEAGVGRQELVLGIDFAPTLLNLAGLPVPKDMAGVSWRPLFESDTEAVENWRDDFLFEFWSASPRIPAQIAVRVSGEGNTKLIQYPYYPWRELYDLDSDPAEMRNVADEPDYAPMLADMEARMSRLQRETGWRKREQYAIRSCTVVGPVALDDIDTVRTHVLTHPADKGALIPAGPEGYRWRHIVWPKTATFDLNQLPYPYGGHIFVILNVRRLVEDDPFILIQLPAVEDAIAYVDGNEVWRGDAKRGGFRLFNPPLPNVENRLVLELDMGDSRQLELGVNAPQNTIVVR